MAWRIDLTRAADGELDRLDPQTARRILRFLHQRLGPLDDPRVLGEPPHGDRLGNFWKYRVGDYRIIAEIQDRQVRVLVIRVGHRSRVYYHR
jgi:mRNA interferase RelE/StbE